MSHDLSPLGFRKTPFTRECTALAAPTAPPLGGGR